MSMVIPVLNNSKWTTNFMRNVELLFFNYGLQGYVSEITAYFLFAGKFHNINEKFGKIWQLHMNTAHWVQIIVLFENLAINVKFVSITFEYYPLGPNYRPFRPTRLRFRDNGPLPVW